MFDYCLKFEWTFLIIFQNIQKIAEDYFIIE